GWSSISSRGIGFVTMINLDELLSILRVGGAFYVDTQDKSTFTPFAFVLNVKRLKGDRAIELAPGCTALATPSNPTQRFVDLLRTHDAEQMKAWNVSNEKAVR